MAKQKHNQFVEKSILVMVALLIIGVMVPALAFADAVPSIINSSPSHIPPVITSAGGPTSVQMGVANVWTLSAYDPDGNYLAYAVDWGDKGSYPVAAAAQNQLQQGSQGLFQHTYTTAGSYNVIFTVTDYQGLSTKAGLTVTVYGAVSTPKITLLSAPTQLDVGSQGTWSLRVDDTSATYLTYTIDWGDGTTRVPQMQDKAMPLVASGNTISFSHQYASSGTFRITFMVTDNTGQSDKTSTSVIVSAGQAPFVRVASPNGGETWTVGQTNRISWASSSSSLYPSVKLTMLKQLPNGGTTSYQVDAGSSTVIAPNTGYFDWNVGTIVYSGDQFTAGLYTLKIDLLDQQMYTAATDQSDSPLKIVDPNGNNPPVIQGVSNPSSLSVNQRGTWTVNAYDPDGNYLTYAVNWGDAQPSIASATQGPASQGSSQATFQHTYSQAGTYVITFTVTDANGASASAQVTQVVSNVINERALVATSPQGGAQWNTGSSYLIAWGIRNGGSLSDYNVPMTITLAPPLPACAFQNPACAIAVYAPYVITTSATASAGSYSWTIPSDLPDRYTGTQQISLSMTLADGTVLSAHTDSFTVSKSTQPPKPGDTYVNLDQKFSLVTGQTATVNQNGYRITLNQLQSVCTTKKSSSLLIGIADDGPASDVALGVDTIAQLNTMGYNFNPNGNVAIGMAKLFSTIDAKTVDRSVTLAISHGKAVIVRNDAYATGDSNSGQLIADIMKILYMKGIYSPQGSHVYTVAQSGLASSNLADLFPSTPVPGNRFLLQIGDSASVAGKTVKLINVGASGHTAVLEVDGVRKTVSDTDWINGLSITVESVYYSDILSERSAQIVVNSVTVVTATTTAADAQGGAEASQGTAIADSSVSTIEAPLPTSDTSVCTTAATILIAPPSDNSGNPATTSIIQLRAGESTTAGNGMKVTAMSVSANNVVLIASQQGVVTNTTELVKLGSKFILTTGEQVQLIEYPHAVMTFDKIIYQWTTATAAESEASTGSSTRINPQQAFAAGTVTTVDGNRVSFTTKPGDVVKVDGISLLVAEINGPNHATFAFAKNTNDSVPPTTPTQPSTGGECTTVGIRMKDVFMPEIGTQSAYCDVDQSLKPQKADGAECQNNFECQSNTCSSGTCVNLQKQLAENQNTMQKILDFFKKIFGGG